LKIVNLDLKELLILLLLWMRTFLNKRKYLEEIKIGI